jgi:uncharacterized protein (TIGR02246 family)
MKRSTILTVGAALLLPACQANVKSGNGAGETQATAADPAADEQAIRAQVDRWHQLMKAKDAAGIVGLYTKDGAVMPPNAAIGKGPDAIQKVWASLMAIPGFELAIMPEEITVSSSGDMALDRGTYKLNIAPDGKAMTDTGKYVVVWRKVDGEWKAAADIFNSDLPAG